MDKLRILIRKYFDECIKGNIRLVSLKQLEEFESELKSIGLRGFILVAKSESPQKFHFLISDVKILMSGNEVSLESLILNEKLDILVPEESKKLERTIEVSSEVNFYDANCVICDRLFVSQYIKPKYCSDRCRYLGILELKKAWWHRTKKRRKRKK